MRELKFRAWDTKKKVMIYEMKGLKVKPHHIVMQYTSLKDRFGNEIYEGDILTDGVNVADIFWSLTNAGFWSSPAMTLPWPDCRVTGNIYENPDLISQDSLLNPETDQPKQIGGKHA